jgi:hypothetical protein
MKQSRTGTGIQCGRHPDGLFRRAEQLAHRIALSRVAVVLVQLIRDQTVYFAPVLLFYVRG